MTAHQCKATPGTALVLRAGLRSSLREQCTTCGKWTTWIERTDGVVVALDEKRGKRA